MPTLLLRGPNVIINADGSPYIESEASWKPEVCVPCFGTCCYYGPPPDSYPFADMVPGLISFAGTSLHPYSSTGKYSGVDLAGNAVTATPVGDIWRFDYFALIGSIYYPAHLYRGCLISTFGTEGLQAPGLGCSDHFLVPDYVQVTNPTVSAGGYPMQQIPMSRISMCEWEGTWTDPDPSTGYYQSANVQWTGYPNGYTLNFDAPYGTLDYPLTFVKELAHAGSPYGNYVSATESSPSFTAVFIGS